MTLEESLDNPQLIDTAFNENIEKLIEEYPFCASLRLLNCVALANMHSTRFAQSLKMSAASLPERFKLFQLVSNGEFDWVNLMNEIEQKQKAKVEQTNDFSIIDSFLANSGDNISEAPTYDLSSIQTQDYDLDDTDVLVDDDTDDQDDLINKFIEAEETGQLFTPKSSQEESQVSLENDDVSISKIREKAFLSESLAKLYVKQHKYEQALSIFSSLNLKYSKKNIYFADQIRYLETILSYQKEEKS